MSTKMITLKSKSWGHSVGKRLDELRKREILCDVVIVGCDEERHCKFHDIPSHHKNIKQIKLNTNQSINDISFNFTLGSALPYIDKKHLNNKKSEDKNISACLVNRSDVLDICESNKLKMSSQTCYQHKAHSSILAASSTVLQNTLNSCSTKNCMKFLHCHGISYALWEALLQFIYLGTITVAEETVQELQKVAKDINLQELSSLILSTNKSPCANLHPQDYNNEKTSDSINIEGTWNKKSEKQPSPLSEGGKKARKITKEIGENLTTSTKIKSLNENQKIQKLIFNKRHRRKRSPRKLVVQGLLYNNEEDVSDGEFEVETDTKSHLPRLETVSELELSSSKDHSTNTSYTEKRDLFRCDKCAKIFTKEESLSVHICDKYKQEKEGSSFSCSECPKQFSRKHDLKMHSRVHSGEKPYKCSDCSKEFSQKTNMLLHKKTHQNIKNFKCDTCDKTFLRKWGLQEHKKTHSGEKPYLCQTCGKSFSKISNLQVHERIHSGIKPYKCSHCSQSFGDPSTFKQHLVIHSSARAFQCVQCGKQFARFKALKEHERVHTGEKPHVCEICNAKFANTSNFSRHKKFHLKKEKKLQENKMKVENIERLIPQTLEASSERPSVSYSTTVKATPLSDIPGVKTGGLQNPPDLCDISIGSYKSENFVNIIGNNQVHLQQNGNIINQSASISGIIPQELNLQQITANSSLERGIMILPSDTRFIEHVGVMDSVNLEANENQQLYPYQITYPTTFNSPGLVQTNLTFQLPNNLQQ